MLMNMESNTFRLLVVSMVVGAGVTGITSCGGEAGDDSITTAITSIVEGVSSSKISGLGEDEVDVELHRPVTAPTGVTQTTLEQIIIPPSEIVATTSTDADGYYRFTDVPANETYFITFAKAGFIDEAYFEVTVEPEPLVTLEPVPLLETRFDTTAGIVSGTVNDAARPGSPLGGVLVRARAGINNLSGTVLSEDTTLLDNGSYSLAFLDAGNYTLEANRSGYQTAYFDALVLDADSDPLTTNETIVGTVALVPDDLAGVPFSFSGNVFAAYDAVSNTGPFPLGGAAVRIRDGINTTVGTISAESFTNTTGFYSFDSVAAGQYTLEGALSGFNFGFIDIPLGSSLTNQNVTLMPLVFEGSQQLTIVLTWGTTNDLDGRLTEVVPEQVQVPWLNDDRDGFGPETTLLEVVDPGKRYEYFVNDFSGSPIAESAAQVRVYRGNNLIFNFDLPLNDPDAADASDWHVFAIDNDRIIPVNDLIVGPTVSISDDRTVEGDVVNQPLDFAVSLDFVSNSDIVLEMATADGTATVEDNDYQPSDFLYSTDGGQTWVDATGINGTVVTIPAGSDAILVRVMSIADGSILDSIEETFTLSVSRVIFGIVNDFTDTGTGTIVNDDFLG